jgi:hypothetical protein
VGALTANRPKIAQDRYARVCAKTRPARIWQKAALDSNKRCIFLNIELSQAEKLQHLMGQ